MCMVPDKAVPLIPEYHKMKNSVLPSIPRLLKQVSKELHNTFIMSEQNFLVFYLNDLRLKTRDQVLENERTSSSLREINCLA